MVIKEVSLTIEPSSEREIAAGKTKYELYRANDKTWNVTEDGTPRGMHSYELKVAVAIQKVLDEFNGNNTR